jgi:hypothetical protein
VERGAHLRPSVLDRVGSGKGPLALVLCAVAVALVPWTAYVGVTLPARHVTHHWDVVWTGFDLFEVLSIVATALALRRGSALVPVLAAVAGTALLADAWFDVVTAEPGRELGWSLLGLAAELPLAALFFWIAFDATRSLSAEAAPASEAGPRSTARRDRRAGG